MLEPGMVPCLLLTPVVKHRRCTCAGAADAVGLHCVSRLAAPAAKEGATAVKRATSGSSKPAPQAKGSLWSAESVAALKAIGAYSSRKKPDGWAFSRPPSHAATTSKTPADELEAFRQQQEEEKQAQEEGEGRGNAAGADAARQEGDGDQEGAAGNKGSKKKKKRSRKQEEQEKARLQQLQEELSEMQWRRAAALRRSKAALLAEMAVWEEAEEHEAAAAAAGIVSELKARDTAG